MSDWSLIFEDNYEVNSKQRGNVALTSHIKNMTLLMSTKKKTELSVCPLRPSSAILPSELIVYFLAFTIDLTITILVIFGIIHF